MNEARKNFADKYGRYSCVNVAFVDDARSAKTKRKTNEKRNYRSGSVRVRYVTVSIVTNSSITTVRL